METKRISLRIPTELLESIDEMAEASDLSRTAIVIQALEAWVYGKDTALIDSPIETALRVQNIEKAVELINRNILAMNANISADHTLIKQALSKPHKKGFG